MRIRHLVLTNSFAGVERHVCVLANAQERQGHHVEVWGGRAEYMGSFLNTSVSYRPARRILTALTRGLGAAPPSVMHAHMTKAEAAALLPSLVRSTPLITTRHFASPRGSTPGGKALNSTIGHRVAAQIAISDYVSRRIEGPSTVVYPGVEVAPIEETDRRPVVLVVQRLQPEKDTASALRVFADGAPDGWSIEVVGMGPELEALRRLAHQLRIDDRVSFLGFRADVAQLMRSASVLIAPCPVEGLGLSVLEAMAQGLPVLASDAGAHPETVGRAPDARLFPPAGLDLASEMLADLCRDTDLRTRYGGQLRAVQRETFTPKAQAEGTEAVYLEALA